MGGFGPISLFSQPTSRLHDCCCGEKLEEAVLGKLPGAFKERIEYESKKPGKEDDNTNESPCE